MEGRNHESMPLVERERELLKVQSGTEGEIKEVVTSVGLTESDGWNESSLVNDYSYGKDFLRGSFSAGLDIIFVKNMLATLPEGVKLKIFVQKDRQGNQVKFLKDWQEALQSIGADPGKVEMEVVESWSKVHARNWMRDYMLLSADQQQAFLSRVGPENSWSAEQAKFSRDAAHKLGLQTVECPFYFDGGDVKSDNGNLYIGAWSLLHDVNLDYFEKKKEPEDVIDMESFDKKIQEIQNFLGGNVRLVGRDYYKKITDSDEFKESIFEQRGAMLKPPLFHLDLYFTPLGNNQVAVGDFGMFLDLLKEQGKDGEGNLVRSLKQSFSATHEQLDGFVRNSFLPDAGIVAASCAGELIEYLDFGDNSPSGRSFDRIKNYLDSVAAEVKASGMEVVRLPFLPKIHSEKVTNSALVTYNNSLVENFKANGQEHRRIWIPTFGAKRFGQKMDNGERAASDFLDVLDAEAKRILQKAGLEVVPIATGLNETMLDGSLNCKFLEIRK